MFLYNTTILLIIVLIYNNWKSNPDVKHTVNEPNILIDNNLESNPGAPKSVSKIDFGHFVSVI